MFVLLVKQRYLKIKEINPARKRYLSTRIRYGKIILKIPIQMNKKSPGCKRIINIPG